MRQPQRISGDRDAHRARAQRGGKPLGGGGLRALLRLVISFTAPRQVSSGSAAGSGSTGTGGRPYSGDPGGGTPDDPGDLPPIGDPDTGYRTAVWGLFMWGSTIDLWGT